MPSLQSGIVYICWSTACLLLGFEVLPKVCKCVRIMSSVSNGGSTSRICCVYGPFGHEHRLVLVCAADCRPIDSCCEFLRIYYSLVSSTTWCNTASELNRHLAT